MSEASPRSEAAVVRPKRKIWHWALPAALLVLLALGTVVGSAVGPYLFTDATIGGEIAEQVRATTGLNLTARIPGRFDLLPRPHVVTHAIHVDDPTGALSLDADKLDGDVRLLPLIVGRIELSSIDLIRPKLTIDLDARPMQPDSLIGRAMQAHAPLGNASQQLGVVSLTDGTATIRSRALRHAPVLDAINVTLDWRELETAATLTGSLMVNKTASDVAAWIAKPASLMRGEHSAVTLNIHSAPLDVSANGDLSTAATTVFRGHLLATSPSVMALLDLFGEDTPLIAPFANVRLDSDAAIVMDPNAQTSLDFQNLNLRADGNDYEGTLAVQTGERPLLSGTLAAGQLSLAPFLHRIPPLVDRARKWSTAPILGRRPQPLDLDLRISATHMRLPPVTIDDAALAVMTRGDRTEVALVEGKAYGGAVKSRFSVGVAETGINLRGTGSIAGADASTLSWDVSGRQMLVGTFSGSVNLETTGESPAALMGALRGTAKASVMGGEIYGFDLGRGLRAVQRNQTQAALAALRIGHTPFGALAFAARIVDGAATIEDGALTGPEASMKLDGSADISARRLDLHAVATPPETVASPTAPIPTIGVNVTGSYDNPKARPNFGIEQPAPASGASQAK